MTAKASFLRSGTATHFLMTSGLMVFFVLWMVVLFSPGHGMAGDQTEFVQVLESTKSFSETLETFKKEAGKAGWTLLNVNNLAGVLSEHGFTLHPVMTLDVCKGTYSVPILSNDEYRPASAFMPCRVSIYKTSDGRVFVARMNTSVVAKKMSPKVAEIMSASDGEIAEIIAKAVR